MLPNREGLFNAYPVDIGIAETRENKLLQAVISYHLVEELVSGEWVDCSGENLEICGYHVLERKDHSLNQFTIEALKAALGWDGRDPFWLQDNAADLAQKPVQVRLAFETYDGQMRLKVAFLNPYGAQPTGVNKADDGVRRSVQNRLGAKFRALAGGTPANAPKPTGKGQRNDTLYLAARNLGQFIAAGLLDREEVEQALTGLAYDEKVRLARKAALDVSLVEQARERELNLIHDRHAREAAAGRRDQEQSLQEEIKRLRIRATKEGIEAEKALLALEQREELKRAKELGVKEDLIRKKYKLKRKLLDMREAAEGAKDVARRGIQARGTFNVAALLGLQTTKIEERTAKATEKTAKNTDKIARAAERGLAFT